MSGKKTMDTNTATVAVIGSLVVLNILGLDLFGRLDLTRDGQFTLSDASVKTLEGLEDPVTIEAYFTEDLPPPYSSHARYVRDLLEEYFTHGGGNISYRFIDPVAAETEEDKEKKKNVQQDIFGRSVREATAIEEELGSLGIPPIQLRVNEDDKLEVKRIYMGLAIHYGDETEVIPVVQETGALEYDLTTLIRKLTRLKTPKLAFITGHGELDAQKDLSRLSGLLGQLYEVSSIDLSSDAVIGDDIDAVLVVGPSTPFTDPEKQVIDAFVRSGRSAAFLLDAVSIDMQSLEVSEKNHGLTDLLRSWGVTPRSSLVLDEACATINVSQQRGFMRVAQPVAYPYMPLVENLDQEHPLTRGIPGVAFPFVSPLSVDAVSGGDLKVQVLVRSSLKSREQEGPHNMDPFQRWTLEDIGSQQEHVLMAALTGLLPGVVEGQPQGSPARVLVAGSAEFVGDQFLQNTNQALALNLVDWLVLDEDLLAVRARGLGAATLRELDESERMAIKYGNILGLPFLFVLVGIVRWRRRESRRRSVKL